MAILGVPDQHIKHSETISNSDSSDKSGHLANSHPPSTVAQDRLCPPLPCQGSGGWEMSLGDTPMPPGKWVQPPYPIPRYSLVNLREGTLEIR